MSKRKRIALVLGSIVLAVAVFLWFFGLNLGLMFVARYTLRNCPVVKQTPMTLSNTAVSTAPGQTLTCSGYEFEVPWTDLTGTKAISPKLSSFRFKSGVSLLCGVGEPKEFVNSFLSMAGSSAETYKQIYSDAMDSDFSFMQFMLETTPDNITLFGTRKKNVGRAMLLTPKALYSGETGIYRISTNGMKGFQYEDPEAHPKRVELLLYSEDGYVALTLSPGPNRALSQPEINRVVQTLRKTKPQTGGTN